MNKTRKSCKETASKKQQPNTTEHLVIRDVTPKDTVIKPLSDSFYTNLIEYLQSVDSKY